MGSGQDSENEESYDDETSAITRAKEIWPSLCETAIALGWTVAALTVVDHQGHVCWERQAPIVLARDRSLSDDACVRHVLCTHGPLSTPRLIAVAGLKPATVDAQLEALEAQGRISKCGQLPSPHRGRRAFLWDAVDAGGMP